MTNYDELKENINEFNNKIKTAEDLINELKRISKAIEDDKYSLEKLSIDFSKLGDSFFTANEDIKREIVTDNKRKNELTEQSNDNFNRKVQELLKNIDLEHKRSIEIINRFDDNTNNLFDKFELIINELDRKEKTRMFKEKKNFKNIMVGFGILGFILLILLILQLIILSNIGL